MVFVSICQNKYSFIVPYRPRRKPSSSERHKHTCPLSPSLAFCLCVELSYSSSLPLPEQCCVILSTLWIPLMSNTTLTTHSSYSGQLFSWNSICLVNKHKRELLVSNMVVLLTLTTFSAWNTTCTRLNILCCKILYRKNIIYIPVPQNASVSYHAWCVISATCLSA